MPDFCGPCGNPVDGALPPGAAVAGSLPQTVGEHHACTREMAIPRHRELVGLARPPRPCPGPHIAKFKREADCEIARILRCCEARWEPKRPRLVPPRTGAGSGVRG